MDYDCEDYTHRTPLHWSTFSGYKLKSTIIFFHNK